MQAPWACVMQTTMTGANMTVPLDAIFNNPLVITVSSILVLGSLVMAVVAVTIMIALWLDR
jgi:hypothetical protein